MVDDNDDVSSKVLQHLKDKAYEITKTSEYGNVLALLKKLKPAELKGSCDL